MSIGKSVSQSVSNAQTRQPNYQTWVNKKQQPGASIPWSWLDDMDEDPIDSVVRAQLGCQEIADYCQQGPFCSDGSPLSTLYFPLFAFNLVFFCLLLWSRSCDNDSLVLPVSRVCFLVIDRHTIHIDLPLSLWWLFRSESFVSYICVESCVQKGWSISCYPPQIQTFFLSIPSQFHHLSISYIWHTRFDIR